MDALAAAELAMAARPGHAQRALRFQMHFDARPLAVIDRHMAPVVHIEVAVQHGIHVAQQVQVERRGQVQRVVIGRFQDLPGLDAVHAHEQPAAGAGLAYPPEHGVGIVGAQIADAGARIEEQPPLRRDIGR
ncbi:hypothetical protein D3C72_1607680 [compost metagenome]